MPAQSLAEFAATFDRDSATNHLAEAEKERKLLANTFPRERLAALPLEEFAIGLGPGTLCHAYERGSEHVGSIRGGSAEKFGIYRSSDGEWRSVFKDEPDVQKAWEQLRAGLLTVLDRAAAEQWDGLDDLPFSKFTPALRTKLLHVFLPEEILPVFSFAHLTRFLAELGIEWKRADGYTIAANRRLLAALRAIPAVAGWTTAELERLLYAWRRATEPRVLKIAPGEQAAFWNECRNGGFICVGWDDVGDLDGYASSGELRAAFAKIYREKKGKYGEKARRLFLLRDIQEGDIIVANRGTEQVLAVGRVVPPGYEFDETRHEYQHVVHVQWDTSYARRIPPQDGWNWTIAELTPEQRTLILGDPPTAEATTTRPEPMKHPLNKILYGPPGTGKTYRVIRDAAQIASPTPPAPAEAKAVFDALCAQGRIRFATFHQSFSYEDFIEGIRPLMDESSDSARFIVRPGVFKEIATDAMFACLERVALAAADDFDTRWDALMLKIAENEAIEIPALSDTKWRITESAQGNIAAENILTKSRLNCGKAALRGVWAKLHPRPKITTTESEAALGRSGHHSVIAAVYNYIHTLPAPTGSAPRGTVDASDTVCAYLDSGEKSGWRLRPAEQRPRYVLVVDEINRGNISRIFGELITLIEDDKREGEPNGLRVLLPASREIFAVPPNLFLLGTMNTADKSLALLDVALRRRFEFEELAPDFSLCTKFPALAPVMNALNHRIELRKDRDHRIGHAFFIHVASETEFDIAFRRKVIPLLQEYFFNDIEGARYVLGETEGDGNDGFLRSLGSGDKWQRNKWRWFTDVEPGMSCWARLQKNLGA